MYSYGYIVSVSKPNAFVLVRNATPQNPKIKPNQKSSNNQRENIAANQHLLCTTVYQSE